MTIFEAIKAVLSKEKDGLTCKEITNQILSGKLYTFNTADPNSIVGHSLRRHCRGLDFPSAHPVKHFYIVSGKRGTAVYSLIESTFTASGDDIPKKPPVSSASDLLPEEKIQKYYNEHKDSIKSLPRRLRPGRAGTDAPTDEPMKGRSTYHEHSD